MSFSKIKFFEFSVQKIACKGKESKYKSRRNFNLWYIEKYLRYEETAIYEDIQKDENFLRKIIS